MRKQVSVGLKVAQLLTRHLELPGYMLSGQIQVRLSASEISDPYRVS